ncbi:hypothetical protein EV702DRAFT_481466 [Suillus placidus]|uniref:Uncharacterized protein n=1 Tax=Suillus placidus TaxID=48579 RepID=A0A9P6ZRY4_9AGAM|nr:hypothetical protein EV702DRAFT_481466 [Suillus placidus]
MLCWAFCALWVVALLHYDIKAETWSLAEYLRLFAIYCSSTLVCTLEFMVMLSFWGNLKWKHPIATVWFLILGSVGQASRHLIPSENNLELLANSSLPHEDPDMSHLSDSQLDEKVFYFF